MTYTLGSGGTETQPFVWTQKPDCGYPVQVTVQSVPPIGARYVGGLISISDEVPLGIHPMVPVATISFWSDSSMTQQMILTAETGFYLEVLEADPCVGAAVVTTATPHSQTVFEYSYTG